MLIRTLMFYKIKCIPFLRDDKTVVHKSINYRNIFTLKMVYDDLNTRTNNNNKKSLLMSP